MSIAAGRREQPARGRWYADLRLRRCVETNAVVDGQATATKNTLVLGQVLYAEAAKAGDTQTAMKLAADLALEATKAGQSVQSLRMLKRLTPEGKLYYLRRTVDNLNAELASKATRKGVEPAQLEIKPELAERLLRAKDGGAKEVHRKNIPKMRQKGLTFAAV